MALPEEDIRTIKYQVLIKSGLLVTFSFLLAWLAFKLLFNNNIDQLKNIHDQKLVSTVTLLSRELGNLGDLITLLANSTSTSKSQLESTQSQLISDDDLRQVTEYFSQFGNAMLKISQIRWLSDSGQELVRVDFNNGVTKVTSAENLQNKQDRYYFSQGMQVMAPNVYFSPIDLNVEHGKVVVPLEPTIRVTMQTSSATQGIKGLLIINYRLENMLETIQTLNTAEAQISIINEQGYWLLT